MVPDMTIIMDGIGWLGVVLLLAAYIWTSLQQSVSDRYLFHGASIIGALCIGINVLYYQVWAAVFLETCIIIIGLLAVRRLVKLRRVRQNG